MRFPTPATNDEKELLVGYVVQQPGKAPIVVTAEHPICLVAAGACRRTLFDAVGLFATWQAYRRP